jgi:thiamine-monophosphate kinase
MASVSACIDVSDGLLADLGHLLDASNVAATIEARAVPLPRGFATACARARRDPLSLALAGGEDYELLFTARAGGPSASAVSRRLGLPVTAIGRIERGAGLIVVGAPPRLHGTGWRHF